MKFALFLVVTFSLFLAAQEDLLPITLALENYNQPDEDEYVTLKTKCKQFVFIVVERIQTPYDWPDSYIQDLCEQELSAYLLSVNSETAQRLYKEYQSTGWNLYDLLN